VDAFSIRLAARAAGRVCGARHVHGGGGGDTKLKKRNVK